MNDWKEQLRQWKRKSEQRASDGEKPSHDNTNPTAREASRGPKKSSLHLNLGVDFGTSFTKLTVRNLGTDRTSILDFRIDKQAETSPFIPSFLWMREDGRLFAPVGHGIERIDPPLRLRWLKQGLAQPGRYRVSAQTFATPAQWPERTQEYLATWYLSAVLHEARKRVVVKLGTGPRDQIVWSGRLGVPIDFYDSQVMDVFKKSLRIAWLLSEQDRGDANLPEIEALCLRAEKDLETDPSRAEDFIVEAELAAEVAAFVTDIHTPEGVYSIFDIGGGTFDGASFRYYRYEGRSMLDFLTSRVDALGLETVAEKLLRKVRIENVRACLKQNDQVVVLPEKGLASVKQDLQEHVSRVVVDAKGKLPASYRWPSTRHPVILCGGGIESKWHTSCLMATHAEHQHGKCGIPPYETKVAPVPADLITDGIPSDQVQRFLVAYGLSLPALERYEIAGFPTSNPRVEPVLSSWQENAEQIQMDLYGEIN